MKTHRFVVLIITLQGTSLITGQDDKKFPDDFMFGVSTSAYQVEGAWNEGGKGETIWDHMIHDNSSYTKDNSTGDVASDFYHKFDGDIRLLLNLGINHYKFSISWSRILPTGFVTDINHEAINFYDDIISLLQEHAKEPVVSLYHWDLPQPLQDIGGWTNPAIIEYFVEYARVVFEYFRTVRYWITFDEPKQICRGGYGTGSLAPGIKVDGVADYLCSYVVVKAHAAVYQLYQDEFSFIKGKVGVVLDVPWSEPYTEKAEDVAAAERRNQFMVGLYANPIVKGTWPDIVADRVQERSSMENFKRSRLPQFTEKETALLRRSFDFLGVNFYDTRYVADGEEAEFEFNPSFDYDVKVKLYANESWAVGTDGNTIVPWGLRKALNWIRTTYNYPTIFITDNSIADDGTLEDTTRSQYITEYLDNVLAAIHEDSVKVMGYTVKFMDEFEWNLGYSAHGGLYSVNFQDPERPRTAKQSLALYHQIVMNLSTNVTTPEPPTTTEESTTDAATTNEGSPTTQESTTAEGGTSTKESTSIGTTEPSAGTTKGSSSYRFQPLALIIVLITTLIVSVI